VEDGSRILFPSQKGGSLTRMQWDFPLNNDKKMYSLVFLS